MAKCDILSAGVQKSLAFRIDHDVHKRGIACSDLSDNSRSRELPNLHRFGSLETADIPCNRRFGVQSLKLRSHRMRVRKMMLAILVFLSATAMSRAQETGAPIGAPVPTVTNAPISTNTAPPTRAPIQSTSAPALPTTSLPTTRPTFMPTSAPQVTLVPTSIPTTLFPTQAPTVSQRPSVSPEPSASPSVSLRPSVTPSLSIAPSVTPSDIPTVSARPSPVPTRGPTVAPSSAPSDIPSQVPSRFEAFYSQENYRITLVVSERNDFNATEIVLLELLFASYTDDFAPDSFRTTTICRVDGQNLFDCVVNDPQCTIPGPVTNETEAPEVYLNDIDFFCNWTSTVTNVTRYPSRFAEFMALNVATVTANLQSLGLEVVRALPARVRSTPTAPPTRMPVMPPSISPAPTRSPVFPTSAPTPVARTTVMPTFEPLSPTATPSLDPTNTPSISPTPEPDDSGPGVGLIVGIVLALGAIALAGLFMFYRYRTKRRGAPAYAATPAEEPNKVGIPDAAGGNKVYKVQTTGYSAQADPKSPRPVVSPSDSLVSRGSGLDGESVAEDDGTPMIQDEFDEFKDRNLEEVREQVLGKVADFEAMMSAAVTRVLMGDDEQQLVVPTESMWGCEGAPSGAEIEASALCEVNDWLKRHEGATVEQKRRFMQDILNRMVTSVRYGVVEAEDASRSIHESAALLSLKLANDLPMTTVIISGMRKKAAASHMMSALKEFGDIDVAAVASGQRGFGIVRFRRPNSVDRAMRRYRSGEIVIQDVAVQIKALMPSGQVEGRR